MARYQPGDLVHVASFGKGIVREVRNHGRHLVEVKGRAMEVAASQLSPVEGKRASRAPHTSRGGSSDPPAANASADRLDSPAANASADTSDPPAVPTPDGTIVTLDLHGYTVEEALEALEQCLNDALLAGASEVRVIHGRSGSRIKTAVHQRLGQLPLVQAFQVDPQNAGVTIVVL